MQKGEEEGKKVQVWNRKKRRKGGREWKERR